MPTDLDACGRYALSCQTDEGGFCFYSDPTWSVEVPNAPDTCAAIGILALRTIPVPRVEQCTAWLRSLQDADGEYPMLIVGYSALRALRVLRSAPRLEPRPYLCGWLDLFAASALPTDIPEGWLTSAARCVELCLACELELTQEMRAGIAMLLQRSRSETGGYGAPGPSLPDSARALTLANAVGLALDDEILAYARQCEHGPFGFNITPFATSSSLETQHAGLTIMLSCGERRAASKPIRDSSLRRQLPVIARRIRTRARRHSEARRQPEGVADPVLAGRSRAVTSTGLIPSATPLRRATAARTRRVRTCRRAVLPSTGASL